MRLLQSARSATWALRHLAALVAGLVSAHRLVQAWHPTVGTLWIYERPVWLGWLGLMAIVRLAAHHTAPEPFRGTPAFAAGLLISGVFWMVSGWALLRLLVVLINPSAPLE